MTVWGAWCSDWSSGWEAGEEGRGVVGVECGEELPEAGEQTGSELRSSTGMRFLAVVATNRECDITRWERVG